MGNIEKDRLCQQLKKDVRGNAKQFWEALKAAAQSVYDSTDAAFMAFASPSDCMMSLEQFQDTHFTSAQMLRADPRMRRMSDPLGEYLGFALSYNCAKSLFEQKLRDWESYAFTLEDFQDGRLWSGRGRLHCGPTGSNARPTEESPAKHVGVRLPHRLLHQAFVSLLRRSPTAQGCGPIPAEDYHQVLCPSWPKGAAERSALRARRRAGRREV
eukprot:g6476.t1